MAHVKVQLRLDASGKRLLTVPPVVVVDPKDTVEWKCDDGDITVAFDTGLFDGHREFRGSKGTSTNHGTIRADVTRGKHFDCKVTFNGKPTSITYGIDTSGSGE
jgi:hypothetical protein